MAQTSSAISGKFVATQMRPNYVGIRDSFATSPTRSAARVPESPPNHCIELSAQMPILQKEPHHYPSDLLTELDADVRTWRAVYTSPRQEKALARDLYAMKVPFFLPLVRKDRVSKGRRLTSYLPVFDNYLFLCSTEDERVKTLTTNRISRMLPVGDQDHFCAELVQLKQLIEMDAPLTVERMLETGRSVRVKGGAFRGLEGVVIRRRGRDHLLVALTCLQQGVSVELDDVMLEAI